MKYTNEELNAKKKEINSLIDDFFMLSKHDEEARNKLLEKIRKLENEVQHIHNELKVS